MGAIFLRKMGIDFQKVARNSSMDMGIVPFALPHDTMQIFTDSFEAYDRDMSLDFHSFQLAVLFIAVFLTEGILNDGSSNWLEGHPK